MDRGFISERHTYLLNLVVYTCANGNALFITSADHTPA